MNPLLLVFRHSCLNMNIYGLEDIATFKCISTEFNAELTSIYTDEERKKKLPLISAINMGYNSKKPIPSKTLLNRDVYVRYMVELTKFYKPEVMYRKLAYTNLSCFLDAFTLQNSQKCFIKYQNLTMEEQVNTMDELLAFTIDNKNKASKMLAIYLIYYFVSKLYKHNVITFVKNRKLCILACRSLRYTIVSKGTQIVSQCKNDCTMFPYKFIEKVIRVIQGTNRYLKNI